MRERTRKAGAENRDRSSEILCHIQWHRSAFSPLLSPPGM
jgi:hypothetical protein